MRKVQAFPIAIIDEDHKGKNAAGRGMQQQAAAIEKEGFRVVAGAAYDGYRGISSASPARSANAITFATHPTRKLLAAWSQASMIHMQHAENKRLDMAPFFTPVISPASEG